MRDLGKGCVSREDGLCRTLANCTPSPDRLYSPELLKTCIPGDTGRPECRNILEPADAVLGELSIPDPEKLLRQLWTQDRKHLARQETRLNSVMISVYLGSHFLSLVLFPQLFREG